MTFDHAASREQATRSSYYGSQKCNSASNRYMPHWLSCTFPEYQGIPLMRSLGVELRDGLGRLGYTHRLEAWEGDIACYWHRDLPGMGSHVVVRGGGFDRLAEQGEDILGFCLFLRDNGGKARRTDIAWDDRAERVTLERVRQAWERDEYTSLQGPRSQNALECVRGKTGGELRETFYFPSMSSKTGFCRIYNKRLERLASGHDDPGPWTRIELSAKGERAEQAFEWYCEGDAERLAALTRRYIEFREPGGNSQKCRQALPEWWSAFWQGLGDGQDTRLAPDGRSAEERALAREAWERSTALPAVARRYVLKGFDPSRLLAELQAGAERDLQKHPEKYSAAERAAVREVGIAA